MTWVLRRFADVQAALHERRLVVPGTAAADCRVHRVVRRAVGEALTASAVASMRPVLVREARLLLEAFPEGAVVDFGATVAEPWSRGVTVRLMALDDDLVAHGSPLARIVFEAAARSTDGETTAAASEATVALARAFGAGRSPATVQTFVALSQSLPVLLSGVVLALLENPAQSNALRGICRRQGESTAAMTAAVHELLRYSTPSRAVYRRAVADVRLGENAIAAGDLVVLRLAEANRDAAVFPEPDRLDLTRGAAGHMTFGEGAHRCSGSAVVRLLVECLLNALATSSRVLVRDDGAPVGWLDGPALRAPREVPVYSEQATDAR